MLVAPELAERARELLREPGETNGKGWHMSGLRTYKQMTAGIGLGLEPPLSPPVVRGYSASVPMLSSANISDLPTPPPAIRPPESVAPVLEPAPAPQAAVPQQPEQSPVGTELEPVLPAAAPESAQLQPETPSAAPELPATAPVEEQVIDDFPSPEPAAARLPEIAPVEATPIEPVRLAEMQPTPLVAPAPPVEEPAAELPTMAPPEPAVEVAPVAFFAPQPVEVEAEVAPEPIATAPIDVPEPELRIPDDPFEAALPAPEPVVTPELEELFAPKRGGHFRVVVRLKEAEGVEVGEFRDFGTAMEGAQEVIEQFSNATGGRWPFYAGRFIRPDLIVSVDVVDAACAD